MTFGDALLVGALASAVYAALSQVIGDRTNKDSLQSSGRNALYATAALVSIASLRLLYLLVVGDFQNVYVAGHTSSDLPLFYVVSAFWAGAQGSLLLWAWLLGVFTVIVALVGENDQLNRYSSSVLMIVESFFLVLLLMSSPFERYGVIPAEGMGLNPLLQDPGMVFHPPTLFIGYAGFAVPFAYAMAGLFLRDEGWVERTKNWTLFSWIFLGLGILFGGYWAYTVLGWGGYWAWDPVENASLLPWLTGTAFLHSIMIQEKRGGLKIWNVLLILATFELTIYGTMITRTGILSSVHAFGESGLGPAFLLFMGAVFASSLTLLVWRPPRGGRATESLLSRETSFLVNNWVFTVMMATVLWGTSFPFISEAVQGYKATIGPAFFNQANAPLGLLLLAIMAVCPLLAWQGTTLERLRRSFTTPLIGAVASVGIGVYFTREPLMLLVVGLCAFTGGTHLLDLVRSTRKLGIRSALSTHRRRYGGYIVHIAVLLIVIGVAGSTIYHSEQTVQLSPGETARVDDYTMRLEDIQAYTAENPTREVSEAVVTVSHDGGTGTIKPAFQYYPGQDMRTTEIDVYSTPREDFYVVYQGGSSTAATMEVHIRPLISLLWYGGGLMLIGGLVAFTPLSTKNIGGLKCVKP